MKINIGHELLLTHFEAIIITALEGGSNYWYELIDDYDVPKIEDKSLSERIAHALYNDPTFSLNVYDIENDGELLGVCTQTNMLTAFSQLPNETLAIIDETYDANTADSIFQYAVMGKIVFG